MRFLSILLLLSTSASAAEVYPWRFQGDAAYQEKDPQVTVFLGELETFDGKVMIRQDVRNPVTMKLSQFVAMIGDLTALRAMQESQKVVPLPPPKP
jgi:hypothetical protein